MKTTYILHKLKEGFVVTSDEKTKRGKFYCFRTELFFDDDGQDVNCCMSDVKVIAQEDQMIAGDIFVPGEYIVDELEARGMKQVDLANELKLSKSEMSLIIHGKRSITVPVAIKLERVFGIDAEFWMNLQVKYDIEKLKRQYSGNLKARGISTQKKNELRRAIAVA